MIGMPSGKDLAIGAGVVGGLALVVTGVVIYKKNAAKIKAKKDDKAYAGATVGTVNVIETAQQIGQDLGVAYAWYNAASWTENDKDVLDTVKAFPQALIPRLRIEYAKKYPGRVLQQDLQKLLPNSYWQQIRAKFL